MQNYVRIENLKMIGYNDGKTSEIILIHKQTKMVNDGLQTPNKAKLLKMREQSCSFFKCAARGERSLPCRVQQEVMLDHAMLVMLALLAMLVL